MLRGRPLLLLLLLWGLSPVLRLPAQAPSGGALTVEAVAADERLWPREVITKAASTVTVEGRRVTVPAGEILRLLRVEREEVVAQFQGATVRLPAAQTDLLAGANTRRTQLGIAVSPGAASSGAAPPGTGQAVPTSVAPSSRVSAPPPTPTSAPSPPSLRPTPRDLSAPEPTPLTRKAQADRVVRNVIAKEGLWILGLIAAAIAIAVIGKRAIDS